MSIFSDRLNGIITSRGYQQKKLAADLDLSPARLNNYIKGVSEPNFEILATICNYLHVTADYMIGISDTPRPQSEPAQAKSLDDTYTAIVMNTNAARQRDLLDGLHGTYYDQGVSYLNYLHHQQETEMQSSSQEA